MAIRISIALCFFGQLLFSQGTESQRKYSAENMLVFTDFIISSGAAGEFKTHYHSELVTTDIYLDTPEKDLFHKGLSLRFRRRMITPDSAIYSFQLKTEMLMLDGIRTEVDEPDLEFYQVILPNYISTLPKLLDSLFYVYESPIEDMERSRQLHTQLLQAWMKQKAGAPISPFQKLLFLYPKNFDETKIGSLMPVCIGTSKRLRSHIYLDTKDYSGDFGQLFRNPEAVKEKLAFFEERDTFIWVMESSMDSSIFRSLLNSGIPPFTISEYEVENKYQQENVGAAMMNVFEKWIIEKFALTKTMDSKYRQSMVSFGY